jgi:DNA-binding FadR family transcriptional regulator
VFNPTRLKATSRKIKSLHGRVANDLGSRILAGEFKPGNCLPNEAECGRAYGVSRTAVREAMKMLAAKGLVQSRPKIGSMVEPRSRWNLFDRSVLGWYCAAADFYRFAKDVQQIRLMVEPEAAALAAREHTPQELAQIEQAFAQMAITKEADLWIAADVRFHLAILNASGNELLVPFGRVIESLLANLFEFTHAKGEGLRATLLQHEAILKAVRERKAVAARHAVRRLLAHTDRIIERAHNGSAMRRKASR